VTRRLYDAGALGLAGYARTRFRVRPLGARFALDPGGLVVSSHRSDADVPVLVSVLYRHAYGRFRLRGRELHFAVRDDLFLRGFFGGYPPGLPQWARRLLYPVAVGGILEQRLPCHPIRSATRLRLVELFAEHQEAPVAELLSDDLLRPFRERGLQREAQGRDALRGRYADLLWRVVEPAELTGPLAEESWRRRAAAALADFRALCEVIRTGGTLLVFPEGRPSPDGELGPVQPGLAALVRRARPRSLQPLALAYDPLVRGRPLAYVGIGEPREPTDDEEAVLELLRRTTPLTAGQLVASRGGDAEVEAALAEGRPVAPELRDPAARAARLAEARAAAAGRDLGRLAREFRSAHA
jgi:1-acyl-sn-glycerol-3-phosphate acyltransferase